MGESTTGRDLSNCQCARCGERITDGSEVFVCEECGQIYHRHCWEETYGCTNPFCEASKTAAEEQRRSMEFNDHLTGAILSTIFCCLPFGIVAIYFSSEASARFSLNDKEGAEIAAKNAKNWIRYSVVTGIVVVAIRLITMLNRWS